MDNFIGKWKQFINEVVQYGRVTSTAINKCANDHMFLVDDSLLKQFREQHRKLGHGSAFHADMDPRKIVDAIGNIKLKSDQSQYQIEVTNVGYRLIISKQEAESLKKELEMQSIPYLEDTVLKRDASRALVTVKRLNIKADLNNPIFRKFETNIVDIVVPVDEFDKVPGISPSSVANGQKVLEKVINKSDTLKKFFMKKKLHTLLSAYPSERGFKYPKATEWSDRYYIVYPSGMEEEKPEPTDTEKPTVDTISENRQTELMDVIYESLQEQMIIENELGDDTSSLDDGTPVCEACLYETLTCGCPDTLQEAKYQGRTVQLGKPFLTPDGPKKRSVYVRNPKTGNVKKVNFGDKKLRIKKSNPKRRKSFRARHKCSQKKDRTTAGYWSCKFWE